MASSDESLEQLLARIRRGDRDAGAEFCQRYSDQIRRRVRGKLRDCPRCVDDSGDVVQLVMMRLDVLIADARLTADTVPEVVSLLMRMADAAAIDAVRTSTRRARREAQLAARCAPPDDGADAPMFAERQELARMVDALSPEDRLAIVGKARGRSMRILARQLGCSAYAAGRRCRGLLGSLARSVERPRRPR